ncbi:MAG: hypothetical protein DHS20C17_11670 [Cyclobacteriaceae bacterium]|nr:MAG: hypothetical protein DHS20C17_11670 [Cyclobacteriaceae bacterium]
MLTLIFEGLSVYQKWSPDNKIKLPNVAPLVGPLLLVSAITTLITVIGGYLLFRSGEYQGELVSQHLWGGVLLIIALNSAAFFYWWPGAKKSNKIQAPYQGFLFLAGALVIITSHIGGTITHGQDFLTEHMPSLKAMKPAPVEQKEPAELLVFQDLIMPIIEDKCQSCHNQYKTKGGLIMTSFSSLMKGGDSEKPMLVPSQPADSELFHRITLPDDHDDKMPPPEKKQLNQEEVDLIKWWIDQGADDNMLLGSSPPDTITQLLENYLPRLFQSERLKMRQEQELESLAKELAELGDETGLVIELDPENRGFFTISMQMPPASITNHTVTELTPYAPLFTKISLPGADINDDALFEIGKMKNLKNLYLPKTCVTGEGLAYLKDLDQLESINLSNSELNNQGVLNLIHLPSVEEVYVWGAETDTLVLKALRTFLPEVKILEEEGAYF